MPKPLNVFLTTYNLNQRAATASSHDLQAWITSKLADFRSSAGEREPADIAVIAAQEIGPLHLALAGMTAQTISLLTLQMSNLLTSHAISLRPSTPPTQEHYTLLGLSHHTNVAVWVFALDRTLPSGRLAKRGEKGMVVGKMVAGATSLGFIGGLLGNKSAAGARIWVERGDGEKPQVESLTFVGAHLTPHPQNIEVRIADYDRITSRLVLPLHPPSSRGVQLSQIQSTNHVFLLGDLNYRLSSSPSSGPVPPTAQVLSMISQGHSEEKGWKELAAWDSLTHVRSDGRSVVGFDEGDISAFAPTYKREIGRTRTYSSKRTPAWTDRIFYASTAGRLSPLVYTSIPSLILSDHAPVILTLALPHDPASASISLSTKLPIQVRVAPSQFRIALETWIGYVLDRTVGLLWTGLLKVGGGNEIVGGLVLALGLLAAWWLSLV